MTPEQRVQVEYLIDILLDVPAEGRTAELYRLCADDSEIRAEVLHLLAVIQTTDAPQGLHLSAMFQQAVEIANTAADDMLPGTAIGPYLILENLGEGGFGSVYKAAQRSDVKRIVALKVIKPGVDTKEVLARFEGERQALAYMNHPSIAKLFHAGKTEKGRPYFVMEYVPGVPITEFADLNRLTISNRLMLFRQVCDAITHAHQKGIIHRDIKASNVLAYNADDHAVAKVIDFGIAKALTGDRLTDRSFQGTGRGIAIGTYDSMSPEQANGEPDIDTRTDVYSLGVLLYELLTGVKPFDEKTFADAADDRIRTIIREIDPPKPSTRLFSLGQSATKIAAARQIVVGELTKTLKSELEWIPLMAMRKERDRRYPSSIALASDIASYLENRPLRAGPESLRYYVSKSVRRNRSLLVTTIALTMIVIITVSLYIVGIQKEQRKTDAALENAESLRQLALIETYKVNRELSERCVDSGIEAWKRNDAAEAILWFVRSIELDADDLNHQQQQRMRIEQSFQYIARPLNIPSPDCAEKGISGGRLLQINGVNVLILDLETGKPLAPSLKHESQVRSVAFSPDGQYILTVNDSAARVWNAATGKLLTTMIPGDSLGSATFSPDGKRIMIVSSMQEVRIWNAETGKPVSPPMVHDGLVLYAMFNRKGTQVVTTCTDKTARIWDAETGKPLTPPMAQDGLICSAQFSPDGTRIVTASSDGTACIWDAVTGQAISSPLRHQSDVTFAAFSPDGMNVVTTSSDKTACIWDGDAEAGFQFTPPMFHDVGVKSATFSPDGKWIATVSYDGSVRIWDSTSGIAVTPRIKFNDPLLITFNTSGCWVTDIIGDCMPMVYDMGVRRIRTSSSIRGGRNITISSDGKRVLTTNGVDEVHIWNANTGEYITSLVGLNSLDKSFFADFSCDGKKIVTTSRHVQLWDCDTGKQLTFLAANEYEVHFAKFNSNGKWVLTVGGAQVRIWDADTGKPLTPPMVHTGAVLSAMFSPEGNRVVTTCDDKTVHVWDAENGTSLTPPMVHSGTVLSAMFNSEGNRVVTTCDDMTAHIWDAKTGRSLMPPIPHHNSKWFATISPDGKRIVTAASATTACVWNVESGIPLTSEMIHAYQICSAMFSPDGKRIVTASYDKTAYIWDAETGKPLAAPMVHDDGVDSAIFSPDGKWILTVSGKQVRIWDADTGKPLTPPMFRGRELRDAIFSRDGRQVVFEENDHFDLLEANWGISSDIRRDNPFNNLSMEEIKEVAELSAFRTINGAGIVIQLSALEWRKRWDHLRLVEPKLFQP